jgi:hypothetical protein
LKIIKRICTINILNEATTPSTEMKGNLPSFRFDNFSFANTVIRNINPLIKSVIYDSECSDPLTYDKDRFLGQIKPVADRWIETPNDRMKVKGYDTMQVLEKLKDEDKIIKMEFANTAYVPTTSMTLVSSTKLIKEGYDRDMHTKTLVHAATEKKVCDIEEHFGIMTLEYNPINVIDESTTTVEMTAPNEMLNNQAPKEKEMKKTPQPITNSESVSIPITRGKSDREPHTMKLNQSDEAQRNPSLNNPHPSRQIDSGDDEDHFTKTPNANDGPKRRFIKAPNIKNGGHNKHKKSLITNQKEMENNHQKDPNRTAKAWWRSPANGVQITPANGVKKRPPIEGFSGDQYEFSKHAHQDMQHPIKLDHKRR